MKNNYLSNGGPKTLEFGKPKSKKDDKKKGGKFGEVISGAAKKVSQKVKNRKKAKEGDKKPMALRRADKAESKGKTKKAARIRDNYQYRQEAKTNPNAGPVAPMGRTPGDGTAVSLHDIKRHNIKVPGAGTMSMSGVPNAEQAGKEKNTKDLMKNLNKVGTKKEKNIPAASNVSKALDKQRAKYGKMRKAKKGSFGMLSVKAGIDKNPNPTAADRIAGATMKDRRKKKK